MTENKQLPDDIDTIYIDGINASIQIVEIPDIHSYICYGEGFELVSKQNILGIKQIEQMDNNQFFYYHNNGTTILTMGNGNTITINGKQVSGGAVTEEKIVLYLSNQKKYHMAITTKSGNVIVNQVDLASFYYDSMSGSVEVENSDIAIFKAKSMSGSIYLEMAESPFNCAAVLEGISGHVRQEDREIGFPEIKQEKNKIDISTLSGDINVVYLGAKQKEKTNNQK